MDRLRRLLGVWLVAWVVAACFTLLLFGSWNTLVLIASASIGAGAAAALAATVRFAPLGYAFRLRWLRHALAVPQRTVVDFWILTRELGLSFARGEPTRGVFRAKPFDAGRPTGPVSSGWRAFVGAAAGYSPNAYVVELDPERGQALVHDLVPDERSEAPA